MKTKLAILLAMIFFNFNSKAQQTQLFVAASIDPSMIAWGPGHSYNDGDLEYLPGGPKFGEINPYPDISSSLDIEFSIGLDIEFYDDQGIRIRTAWQTHPAIGYDKLTFPAVDYMLKNHLGIWLFENFNSYAGAEFGVIYRYHPDATYDQPNNYLKTVKSFSVGLNVELEYNFTDHIAIGVGSNWFVAEYDLKKDDKHFRFETHGALRYKF